MLNLTQTRSRKTLEKLKLIDSLCDELGIDFDNSITNDYRLIYKDITYSFYTYDSVISCLKLIKERESENNGKN